MILPPTDAPAASLLSVRGAGLLMSNVRAPAQATPPAATNKTAVHVLDRDGIPHLARRTTKLATTAACYKHRRPMTCAGVGRGIGGTTRWARVSLGTRKTEVLDDGLLQRSLGRSGTVAVPGDGHDALVIAKVIYKVDR